MIPERDDITDLNKDELTGTAMILSRQAEEWYCKINMLDLFELYYGRSLMTPELIKMLEHFNKVEEVLSSFDPEVYYEYSPCRAIE